MGEAKEEPEEFDDLKYGQAIDELDQILTAIEEDRFDLDELAEQVDRAAQLIRVCRTRIDATELQIRSIIDDLDDEES